MNPGKRGPLSVPRKWINLRSPCLLGLPSESTSGLQVEELKWDNMCQKNACHAIRVCLRMVSHKLMLDFHISHQLCNVWTCTILRQTNIRWLYSPWYCPYYYLYLHTFCRTVAPNTNTDIVGSGDFWPCGRFSPVFLEHDMGLCIILAMFSCAWHGSYTPA